MQVSYSQLYRISDTPKQFLNHVQKQGITHAELFIDNSFWHDFDTAAEIFKKTTSNVKYTIHAPAWETNLTAANDAISKATYTLYEKTILLAAQVNCDMVVIHPGQSGGPCDDKNVLIERSKTAMHGLCEVAKKYNIRLGVENVGNEQTCIFTQNQYVDFVHNLPKNAFYLLDLGHANVQKWDVPLLISQCAHRLIALHIHDNFAQADEHLPMGEGNLNWDNIYKEMKKIKNSDCHWVIEYRNDTQDELMKKHFELLNNL